MTDNSFCSCLLCRKQFENSLSHSIEHCRKVYVTCEKYLSDEIKGGYFHWDHHDLSPHSPFCTVCFKNAEKLCQIDEQLFEIQRRLTEYLTIFNLEIINARNELIISENGPENSTDLESFHSKLLNQQRQFDDIVFVNSYENSENLRNFPNQILQVGYDILSAKTGLNLENYNSSPINLPEEILDIGNLSTITASTNSDLECLTNEILDKHLLANLSGSKSSELENLTAEILDQHLGQADSENNLVVKNAQNQSVQNDEQNSSEVKTAEVEGAGVKSGDSLFIIVQGQPLLIQRQLEKKPGPGQTSLAEYVANWRCDEGNLENEVQIQHDNVRSLQNDSQYRNLNLPSRQFMPKKDAISNDNLYKDVNSNEVDSCDIVTDGAQISIVLPNCISDDDGVNSARNRDTGLLKNSETQDQSNGSLDRVVILPKFSDATLPEQNLPVPRNGNAIIQEAKSISTLATAVPVKEISSKKSVSSVKLSKFVPPPAEIAKILSHLKSGTVDEEIEVDSISSEENGACLTEKVNSKCPLEVKGSTYRVIEEISTLTEPIKEKVIPPPIKRIKIVLPSVKRINNQLSNNDEIASLKKNKKIVKIIESGSEGKITTSTDESSTFSLQNEIIVTVLPCSENISKVENHDIPSEIGNHTELKQRRKPGRKRQKKHHPSAGYMCQECGLIFTLTVDLDLHSDETGHRNEKRVHCTLCPKQFYKRTDLHSHKQVAHKVKKLCNTCAICKRTFENIGHCKKHNRRHTGDYPACKTCGLKFPNDTELAKHALVHLRRKGRPKLLKDTETNHVEEIPEIEMRTDAKEKEILQEKEQSALKNVHVNIDIYEGNICNMTFQKSSELQSHCTESGHKSEKLDCSKCPDGYYRVRDLKSHIVTHKEIKNLICSICFKSFESDSSFKDHFQDHTEDYPECKDCGIKFAKELHFDDHIDYYHSNKFDKMSLKSTKKDQIIVAIEEDINANSIKSEISPSLPKNLTGKSDKKEKSAHRMSPNKVDIAKLPGIPTKVVLKKGYLCGVCSTVFPLSEDLDEHVVDSGHANDKAYRCRECPRKFYKQMDLRNHRKVHQKTTNYNCEICSEVYGGKLSLQTHLKTHAGESPECVECEMKFKTVECYLEHVKRHQDELKCDICNEKFTWGISLKNHRVKCQCEKSANEKKIVYCDGCGEGFPDMKSLDDHCTQSGHITEKKWKCSTCNIAFYRKKDLQNHNRKHSTNAIYECHVCKKTFGWKITLQNHTCVQTPDLYGCHVCSDRFATKLHLSRHMEKHSGIPFVCEFCGKSFKDKGRYRRHIRLHNGEYFACDLCPKKCYTQGELNDHNNIHKGLEPHKCPTCAKTFCTSDRLQKHKKIHRPKEAISCPFCTSGFTTQKQLQKHMKSQHSAFNCTICEKQYPSQQLLDDHIKFSHQMENEFTRNARLICA